MPGVSYLAFPYYGHLIKQIKFHVCGKCSEGTQKAKYWFQLVLSVSCVFVQGLLIFVTQV